MTDHPQLARKLEFLYILRVNPAIRTNADLARELGVTRQSISRWCSGTATSRGDRIPPLRIDAVSRLFQLPSSWWSLELEEFRQRVRQELANRANGNRASRARLFISSMPITPLRIFGREQELDLLDCCWRDPKVTLAQLVAFGGTGKSALVNAWLSELDSRHYDQARNIYAWSFHWQGDSSDLTTSGDAFIEHALEWFGDPDPLLGNPWTKAERLAKLIQASPTLLILDGLEPMQYGPGERTGQIENPAIALLVRELAVGNNGLCLITSRLPVTDLNGYQDGRVATLNLANVAVPAGVEMLASMGLNGSQRELAAAVKHYSGHALSLSLLGGYVSTVHQGRLAEFQLEQSLAEELEGGPHARKLIEQYLDWFDDSATLELLNLVCLFDRSITLADLKAFARSYRIEGLTASLARVVATRWSYAIKHLCDAKLIAVRESKPDLLLDCHPIVRDFVAERMQTRNRDTWLEGNAAIFQWLQEQSILQPATMNELDPLFRAVIHGVRAEKYEEAFEVYYEKIKRKQFSIHAEGSHYSDHASLKAFFNQQWSEPIDNLPDHAKGFLLCSAATNLIYLGEISKAILPSQKSISWFLDNHQWVEAVTASAPVLSMLIAAGEMNEATKLLKEMEPVVRSSNNAIIRAMETNFRGYMQFLMGNYQDAGKNLAQADEVLTKPTPLDPAPFPTISAYYCKYLLDTGSTEEALARSLKTFAWRRRKTWQVAIDTTSLLASDLMVLGLIFLELGDLRNAEAHLDKQVELLRSAGEWLYLPTGLNSRARLYVERGNYKAAMNDLRESLEITTRTGARFGEWEAYLELAHLHHRCGELERSAEYLDKAQQTPNMASYKFRDSEISRLQAQLDAGVAFDRGTQENRRSH